MRFTCLLFGCLGVGLWSSSITLADSVILNPTKDNTLYEDVGGGVSNGVGRHLFTGVTSAASIRRALLAFDVAGNVPAGATVTSVVLTLNVSRVRTNAVQTVEIHRVLADWGEGASNAPDPEGFGAPSVAGDATWLHAMFPGVLWTVAGGDFSPTISGSQGVGGVGIYNWGSSAQMVADVQDWLDNPGNNFGWILLLSGINGSAKRLDSRESPTPSFRPTLEITFTPGCVPPDQDTDGDGHCDSVDICPGGDDNVDVDGDDTPDFCDVCPLDNPDDSDADGVCTSVDPCTGFPNIDADGDGLCDSGDPCTGFPNTDGDSDGICDSSDLCTGFPNVDGDSDGLCDSGDPCVGTPNVDSDGDGICDSSDLCTGSPNVDADGDGLCDSVDPCTGFPNLDSDGDGLCNGADLCTGTPNMDIDGDGVCDSGDPCLGFPNTDSDGDGHCDSVDGCTGFPNVDLDGDGICDSGDLCNGFPNVDADQDGTCDSLDPCPIDPFNDSDHDTICDSNDQCPGADDRIDADGDGTPDCVDDSIPTVSEWGLVAMSLMLLVAGKIRSREWSSHPGIN